MSLLKSNPYRNAQLSENEMCLRAKFLIRDLKASEHELFRLIKNIGEHDLAQIEHLLLRCNSLIRELVMLKTALDENALNLDF